MQTKLSTSFQLRSSYSARIGRRSINWKNAYTNSSSLKNANSGTSNTSSSRRGNICGLSMYKRRIRKLDTSDVNVSGSHYKGNILQNGTVNSAGSDYESKAKNNLNVINKMQNQLNGNIPKWLNEAGIPEDVTFEFDYNIDTQRAEVTKISDKKYLESVESVINGKFGSGALYTAFASRIMNGYISSAYYPAVAKSLESCYGQDIEDLYLDKSGNICGANSSLQRALKAEKSGRKYAASRRFPSENIEGLIKRLISDKNITPNVSHMGYDGKSIYTNDGKFKFGKDFDAKLLDKKSYAMRGSIALANKNDYDNWLANEKMF